MNAEIHNFLSLLKGRTIINKLPNTLVKYTKPDGIDIIKNLRLKMSYTKSFNDPFELIMGVKDNISANNVCDIHIKRARVSPELQNKFQQIGVSLADQKKRIKQFTKKEKVILARDLFNGMSAESKNGVERLGIDFRFICFSEVLASSEDEVLLWAHYTDGNKGIRVHFDVDKLTLHKNSFYKMEYIKNRPHLDLAYDVSPRHMNEKYDKLVKTKSYKWKYENEWRYWFHKEKSGIPFYTVDNTDYIKIQPQAIKRIDIGTNATAQFKEDLTKYLGDKKFKHIKLYQASVDSFKYCFKYEICS